MQKVSQQEPQGLLASINPKTIETLNHLQVETTNILAELKDPSQQN